jgi:hypothetical protein
MIATWNVKRCRRQDVSLVGQCSEHNENEQPRTRKREGDAKLVVSDSYGGFAPTLRYQSQICAPVQNSTSRFLRILSKMRRKYFARCGAPMM